MEYWPTTASGTTRSGSTRSSAGRSRSAASSRPASTRCARGAWDIDARVHDMDLNGVYASLNFPSSLAGFAGQRYQLGVSDPDLALAVVRAANDWHLEEWAGTHPGRIIPLPGAVAARSRASARPRSARNAARGLPRRHVPRAARAARACRRCTPATGIRSSPRARRPAPSSACTSGSSSSAPTTSSDAPSDTIGVLFFGWAMFAAVDWLYSKHPGALPRPARSACRRVASAGSPGCSTASTTSGATSRCTAPGRASTSRRARCCSATSGSAPSTTRPALEQRHRIGVDHILPRVRLPAPGRHVARHPGDPARADRRTSRPTTSASSPGRTRRRLFDHPVPDAVQDDPDAY